MKKAGVPDTPASVPAGVSAVDHILELARVDAGIELLGVRGPTLTACSLSSLSLNFPIPNS